jgi:transposase
MPSINWALLEKKSLYALEQRRADVALKRAEFCQWLEKVDPRRLVFLDETGAKTNMIRLYARARKGERALEYAPHGHWNTTTLVAAITWESAIAPMVFDGPMDSLAFAAYVAQVLIPELPASSIVEMDNLSAHKSRTTQKLFEHAGIELRYQPPYSPDFNPIELMWAKVKNYLRSAKARTQEQLYEAIAQSLDQITSHDTQGVLRYCKVAIIS